MRNQKLRSVRLKCGHFVLVPSYQGSKPADYEGTFCTKCTDTKKK